MEQTSPCIFFTCWYLSSFGIDRSIKYTVDGTKLVMYLLYMLILSGFGINRSIKYTVDGTKLAVYLLYMLSGFGINRSVRCTVDGTKLAPCENVSSVICEQRKAQISLRVHPFHVPLESKCTDETAHARGVNLNLCILRMFEDAVSLGTALIVLEE